MKKVIILTLFSFIIIMCKAQNWTQVPSGTINYLSSCSFGSSTHVYVVGNGPDLLKSTDAGNTFSSLSTSFLSLNQFLNACFFTSADTGFVVGGDGNSNGLIFKTSNGGSSWINVLPSAPTIFNAITFPTSQVGYAVGGMLDTGIIYKTINGGATWTQVYHSGLNPEYLSGVHFRNANDGAVVGMSFDGTILAGKRLKLNGGVVSSSVLDSIYFSFNDVYFSSADTGFLLATDFNGSYILKTTNGGISWNPVYTNMMQDVSRISFPTLSKGYVVGSGGLILKSTNAGNSWSNVSSGVMDDLVDVRFFDSTKGIIVGDQGIILKTVVCTGSSTSFNLFLPPSCTQVNVNGQVYTSSGTYTQLFTNAQGCDSLLIVHVTINSATSSGFNASSCFSYQWNGTTYTNSGVYTQVVPNSVGCDSTITLNLSIVTPNINVNQSGNTLSAVATGVTYQWLNCPSLTPVSGATNQVYTALANGSYAVKITQGTCTDTSLCKTVSGVGVNDFDKSGLKITPNPVLNRFHLSVESGLINASLQLTNTSGQVVFRKSSLNGNEFDIEIGQLAQGIYMLEIFSEKIKFNGKLLRQDD